MYGSGLFNPSTDDIYDQLNVENFREIKPLKSNRKICCVDGGNQELLPTPGYSVQLNRVYFNIFQNKKLTYLRSNIPRRIEFISYTSSRYEENKKIFETKLSVENEDFLKYLRFEEDLKKIVFESDPPLPNQLMMERIASMARRFSEWTIVEPIITSELDKGDIIIKDGTFQTAHPKENKYVNEVFQKAKEKGIIFTGLSKTSRYTTKTPIPLISAINQLAEDKIPYKEWCYYPVPINKGKESDYNALIMIVKLNRYADTPYRFEILKDQAEKMSEMEILNVVSSIADYSRDLTLPGYPYGLIDAHQLARVRDEEIVNYQTMLNLELARLGLLNKVQDHMNTIKTHDKLDEL